MQKVVDWLSRQRLKAKLKKAFYNAGLYVPYKSGDRVIPVYPKIHSVIETANKIEFVFTLKNGMDPKEVSKKEYVFKQMFGRNIELKGDLKKFVLTIYGTKMPTVLKYRYDEFKALLTPLKLGIICGVDRHGQYKIFDLAQMPHILIAGETGSGKSSQLRSILTTLILSKKPHELELYLADCKKSEFHIFQNVKHVKCVLFEPQKIQRMLHHIKKELNERSDLTYSFRVGHIDELPTKYRRPYIVVCIDEFVLLRKFNDIMDILIDIVAIGRTLGVFAILSMQRPSSEVLDTTIRANLTVSMGFKLRDKIESRIVNTPKAEDIEIPGRFMMNSDKLYEIQAPYLTQKEAEKLLKPYFVDDWKDMFSGSSEAQETTKNNEELLEDDILGGLD
ncbi:DNA translocase FtsK (plasmid) [Anoxybacillus caldiproteolyticus]|nr:DNA translocase FtsK [Anoxybacillus caldiproteolyticus]